MQSVRRLGLLDASGRPFDDRLVDVLSDLMSRFRRRFPAIVDEVEITNVFEEAAKRIARREQRYGEIEKLHGYAWRAIESVAISMQRRGSMQVRLRRVESRTGLDVAATLPASHGSPAEIEQTVLLHEVESRMTGMEASVFDRRLEGYSSAEIGAACGMSSNAVDKMLSRARRRVHALMLAPRGSGVRREASSRGLTERSARRRPTRR